LDVDASGQLVTRGGLPVLGDGGPINVPANSEVTIAVDGTVTAKAGNGRPTTVGRLKLVTPEAPLRRSEDGLFRATDGDLPLDPTARLQDGALEGSNVSPVETMVSMIAAARQFEAQMKMLQSAEQNEQSAGKLLAHGG
jgi:flagellar basal-body rod protein FlgF